MVFMGFTSYLSMMRPLNSLMSGIGVVFTALMFAGYSAESIGAARIIVGFATGFTVTAASMIVNDVVDVEVDRVNKPWKPLPSGKASPKTAVFLSILLLAAALSLNTLLGSIFTLTTLVYSLLGVGYSFLRRYWWSQLLVPASVTGPIAYGYIAAGAPRGDFYTAVGLASTIYIVTFGREVLKAIQDLEGDRTRGYTTIPMRFGVKESSKLMAAASVAGPAAGVATGILNGSGLIYTALISLAGALYAYSMIKATRSLSSEAVLEKARRETLLEMLLGLVAFWLFKA